MPIRIKQTGSLVVYSNGPLTGWPISVGYPNQAVQYNDAGVFGGEAAFTYNKNNDTLHLTGSFSQGTSTKAFLGSHAEGNSTQATGDYSHAEGFQSVASDDYAHAEGTGTDATGYGSHAEGAYTTATALWSHAEGYDTLALGQWSHTEGYDTTTGASADYSHAEGESTSATGTASHAEGRKARASGLYSHAEGHLTTGSNSYSHSEGERTLASGYASHTEGFLTTGSNVYSHAEGTLTVASGDSSHAEGYQTTASGLGSHAEGEWTSAVGIGSHAEGVYTIASGAYQHVQGQFNKRDNTQSLMVIGNGTGNSNALRSDIVRVETNSVQVTGSFFQRNINTSTTVGFMGSDSAATPAEKGTDVFFFVEGTPSTKGTATRGVALFDGDVVISGALHGGSPLKIGSPIQVPNSYFGLKIVDSLGNYAPVQSSGIYANTGSAIDITTQFQLVHVQHDAASSVTTGNSTSTSLSWTHTPASTPTGVLVMLIQHGGTNASAKPSPSGVTYGGIALTSVLTFVADAENSPANDQAIHYGYSLTSGVPSGPQTVVVSAPSGFQGIATCVTVNNAPVDLVVGQTSEGGRVDNYDLNDSIDLTIPVENSDRYGRWGQAYASVHTGHAATANISGSAGTTVLYEATSLRESSQIVMETGRGSTTAVIGVDESMGWSWSPVTVAYSGVMYMFVDKTTHEGKDLSLDGARGVQINLGDSYGFRSLAAQGGTTYGNYSTAIGPGTVARGGSQIVLGSYNVVDPNYNQSDENTCFVVGNGYTTESDAIRVTRNPGSVTLPSQPSFLVYKTTANQNNLAAVTDHKIQFETAQYNVGSHFSTGASSTFTAPVTGKYLFTANVRVENVDTASDYYLLRLQTSNAEWRLQEIDPGGFTADPTHWVLCGSVIADMDANDTAHLEIRIGGGGSAQSDLSEVTARSINFSGMLLG